MIKPQVHLNAFAYLPEYHQSDCGFSHLEMSKCIHGCYDPVAHRLCGLVVRGLGYRSGGPGSIPGIIRKKVVSLERGPLSLVSTNEELLDRNVATPA
jgi:hypothetical protein